MTKELSPEHAAELEKHAIDLDLAKALGVYSVLKSKDVPEQLKGYANLPAIAFPWVSPQGEVEWQVRPDKPNPDARGRLVKYRFRSKENGYKPVLWEVREVDGAGTVVISEGTKQSLAVATHAPGDVAVYGIGGCRQWQSEGLPIDDLSVVDGREVVILLDADAAHNREVFDAGVKLAEACKLEGAAKVSFARLPGSSDSNQGIDDILASKAPERRAVYLERVIRNAKAQPADRRPAAKVPEGSGFIEPMVGLRTDKLTRAILDRAPAALTPEDKIAMYDNGVYVLNGRAFVSAVTELLGDDYRTGHRSTSEEYATGILFRDGVVLPDHSAEPLLNLRNGMLDLSTGKLYEHDPKYLSTVQLPVVWDPKAKCPTFDQWLREAIPDQAEDILEVASQMLDPSRTPPKALFAFGPSRSGKSTFLRLLEAIAGPWNCSAVTLHQLSTDSFAAANVYGKILNAAADLSSAEVQDLSVFKMMTGEDSIQANRKYGKQFRFRNRALFAFSANELPLVSETSRAYSERMKPFRFARSFAGHEDPSIEERMRGELDGILVRLVFAWRKKTSRGGYLPTDPGVAHEFEVRSDRVRQWVAERCTITGLDLAPGSYVDPSLMSTKADLYHAFSMWTQEQGTGSMGQRKVIDHLLNVPGVVEVRAEGGRNDPHRGKRGLNMVVGTLVEPPSGREAGEATPNPYAPNGENNRRVLEDLGEGSSSSTQLAHMGSELPHLPHASDTLVFDIETASADELYGYGPGFARLGGYSSPDGVVLTEDMDGLARLAGEPTRVVTGHNIIGFDLQVLHRYHGLDMFQLIRDGRALDTLLAMRHVDPPMAREKGVDATRRFDLDSIGERLELGGKTGDLKALAKEFGGFDQIPTDDVRYRRYLEGDVQLSEKLHEYLQEHYPQVQDPYLQREHQVAGLAARITVNGFKVDTELLNQRIEAQEERKARALQWLNARAGVPLTDARGKPSAAPLTTKLGKQALADALTEAGATSFWTTASKGEIQTSAEAMHHLMREYYHLPQVIKIAKAVTMVVKTRAIYKTIAATLVQDRIHPKISMGQSTGRWSLTLTTMGKHNGRYVEREIFLPDSEDELILAVDLSQVDMRAVAGLSQDQAYIEMLRQEDPHTELAKALFGDPGKREYAKKIGHGWNYGEGLRKISEDWEIEPRVVRQFDTMMRERFPKLVLWQEESRRMAESGELLDNGWGRPMRPDPARAHTQGPALRGQGAARDIMMEGMLRLPEYIHPMLRCQVHDEIVLSVPKSDAEQVRRDVLEALSFDWKGVPIKADASPLGVNWGAVYAK